MLHPEELNLKKGIYAVHNKHNPSFTHDPYNYCYQLAGLIMHTPDDIFYRRYLPLYQTTQDIITNGFKSLQEEFQISMEEFDGFTRLDLNFLATGTDDVSIKRFKFFETKDTLEIYLIDAREQFLLGSYKW
jgi:hypothetical protein